MLRRICHAASGGELDPSRDARPSLPGPALPARQRVFTDRRAHEPLLPLFVSRYIRPPPAAMNSTPK